MMTSTMTPVSHRAKSTVGIGMGVTHGGLNENDEQSSGHDSVIREQE